MGIRYIYRAQVRHCVLLSSVVRSGPQPRGALSKIPVFNRPFFIDENKKRWSFIYPAALYGSLCRPTHLHDLNCPSSVLRHPLTLSPYAMCAHDTCVTGLSDLGLSHFDAGGNYTRDLFHPLDLKLHKFLPSSGLNESSPYHTSDPLSMDAQQLKLLIIALLSIRDSGNGYFKTCADTPTTQSGHFTHQGAQQDQQGDQGAQGGRGDEEKDDLDGEGNNGGKKRDGHRFSKQKEVQKMFECPFRRSEPGRYQQTCNVYPRFCDLKLHIKRQHLLSEKKPYCPNCRYEFVEGSNPRQRLDRHQAANTCQKLSAKDTGVLLPKEYKDWEKPFTKKGSKASVVDKWIGLWDVIFKSTPPSPYFQDTVVAMEDAHRGRVEEQLQSRVSSILGGFGVFLVKDHVWLLCHQILNTIFPHSTAATLNPLPPATSTSMAESNLDPIFSTIFTGSVTAAENTSPPVVPEPNLQQNNPTMFSCSATATQNPSPPTVSMSDANMQNSNTMLDPNLQNNDTQNLDNCAKSVLGKLVIV